MIVARGAADMVMGEPRPLRGAKVSIDDAHSLYHDLAVYGDDAQELFEFLHQKLGVDLTGLNLSHYVPRDGEGHILAYFRKRSKKEARLTVAHLIAVAQYGKWFPPPQA